MIKLKWGGYWIEYVRVEWSGSDEQCSRQVSFDIPSNPYDKTFHDIKIKLGDIVKLCDGKKVLFIGTVTTRERSGEIGTVTYTAMDFMHHLLRSNTTHKFKNMTAESIAKKVCHEIGIPTGKLAATKYNIPKLFFEDQCIYDIIITAYRKAKSHTGKKYMPAMAGKKVSVIIKGEDTGVVLEQGVNITGASYTDTVDDMVNRVEIYSEKGKKLGRVEKAAHVSKYGVYQNTYTKEEKVNAKNVAKGMLAGITKSSSVEALGDIRAVSGYSIKIKDKATGLTGKFYIKSDSHTFENGTHMMQLELSLVNTMEEGADAGTGGKGAAKKKKSGRHAGVAKKQLANSAVCYYTESGTVYHSTTGCSSIKNSKAKKRSTVIKLKSVKLKSGKNKGKRKYKPCSRCWK